MSGAIVDEVLAPTGGDLAVAAASPWQLARRRLLRNRVALVMAALLAVIVALCLCAPLYARHIAHTHPFQSSLDATTIVNGKRVPVMAQSTEGLGLGVTPSPRPSVDCTITGTRLPSTIVVPSRLDRKGFTCAT